jgi:hypothetical protein
MHAQMCTDWLLSPEEQGDADDEAGGQHAASKRRRGASGPIKRKQGSETDIQRTNGDNLPPPKAKATHRKQLRRSDRETIQKANDIVFQGREGLLQLGGRAGGKPGTRAAAALRL